MRLSILVPVLNEAARIDAFLAHLTDEAPRAEVLVADGGSADDTAARAARHVRVIAAPRGRARQMNAGASAAAGDVFWFLHADSHVPPGAVSAIEHLLRTPEVAGGCFRLRIPEPHFLYRWSDTIGNRAVDLFGLACGDHGIFLRRAVFEAIGGYRETPLLEDLDLYRRSRAHGQMRQLPAAITTSPRRWQRQGLFRTTAIDTLLLALYVSGAPIPWLCALDRRLRRPGTNGD
jgi:rSAM/selenodomain-associated transferase 2